MARSVVQEPPIGWVIAGKGHEIARYLRKHFPFPKSNRDAPPSLYTRSATGGTFIYIYGVIKHDEQDRIVDLLKAGNKRNTWGQVYVEFREREIFKELKNGWRARHDEKRLYSTILK